MPDHLKNRFQPATASLLIHHCMVTDVPLHGWPVLTLHSGVQDTNQLEHVRQLLSEVNLVPYDRLDSSQVRTKGDMVQIARRMPVISHPITSGDSTLVMEIYNRLGINRSPPRNYDTRTFCDNNLIHDYANLERIYRVNAVLELMKFGAATRESLHSQVDAVLKMPEVEIVELSDNYSRYLPRVEADIQANVGTQTIYRYPDVVQYEGFLRTMARLLPGIELPQNISKMSIGDLRKHSTVAGISFPEANLNMWFGIYTSSGWCEDHEPK